jgi:hypothetical protein
MVRQRFAGSTEYRIIASDRRDRFNLPVAVAQVSSAMRGNCASVMGGIAAI